MAHGAIMAANYERTGDQAEKSSRCPPKIQFPVKITLIKVAALEM